MLIDASDTTNEIFSLCDQLWRANGIWPGALKHYGGSGRVLWIDNGQIVDYAWCMDVKKYEDVENIESLKHRTRNAFK